MKRLPDGLEGYIIVVEADDLKQPLDLPELQGEWHQISWEGVFKKGGHFHAIYLTNNEFTLEVIFPDTDWLPADIRANLLNALT